MRRFGAVVIKSIYPAVIKHFSYIVKRVAPLILAPEYNGNIANNGAIIL